MNRRLIVSCVASAVVGLTVGYVLPRPGEWQLAVELVSSPDLAPVEPNVNQHAPEGVPPPLPAPAAGIE